jgi:hypothetical protein
MQCTGRPGIMIYFVRIVTSEAYYTYKTAGLQLGRLRKKRAFQRQKNVKKILNLPG